MFKVLLNWWNCDEMCWTCVELILGIKIKILTSKSSKSELFEVYDSMSMHVVVHKYTKLKNEHITEYSV